MTATPHATRAAPSPHRRAHALHRLEGAWHGRYHTDGWECGLQQSALLQQDSSVSKGLNVGRKSGPQAASGRRTAAPAAANGRGLEWARLPAGYCGAGVHETNMSMRTQRLQSSFLRTLSSVETERYFSLRTLRAIFSQDLESSPDRRQRNLPAQAGGCR